ncbi:MAG: LysR family transcriptional regulator [Burkholderiaceae bacterium]|nr:LysR family transcriptional regulator [Burkholderiaceae bacterium]
MGTQDLNDLYYFVQIVEHGGFASAGRALGVPKSKLSRRLALLEQRLGVRLLQRSTRRFSVTEIGQDYYERCKAMLVEAESAQEVIERKRSEPRGIVRLSCPVTLVEAQVGQMVADFMARHPHVDVHLDATNRRVDVIGEAIDIAIRVRPPPLEDSDLVLRVLSERAQRLVASPALLERHGIPGRPEDLPGMPSMALGPPQQDQAWQLYASDGTAITVHHQPRLVTGNMSALRVAALAGIGVVQLPGMVVGEDLGRGDLAWVLPSWSPKREIVHAVFPSRRGLLPSVRSLLDHLAERFEALGQD